MVPGEVAVRPAGRFADLTGGYPLAGDWDGLTLVELASGATTELAIPDRSLAILMLPDDVG